MKTIQHLLITLLLVVPQLAAAADIRVQVYDRARQSPLANAAVCVGTSARIDQFGAHLTDNRGYASFAGVPRAAIVVTVSRPDYKSEQETMVNSNSNRVLSMSLSTGGGGVPCPLADTASSDYAGGLKVTRFRLNNGKVSTGNPAILLNSRVNGQVTQYRASERADLSGVSWQGYTPAATFQLSAGPGKKTVYFQVRRHSDVNGAVIETLSPVARDSITLQ